MRANTTTMLRELGYQVLEAPDGPSALQPSKADPMWTCSLPISDFRAG